MINVSVKQLFESVAEADVFRLPEMSVGTMYLYDNLYGRLSSGDDITLSGLDFGAFDSNDISSMCDIYSDVFERNGYAASGIMSSLRGTAPVRKAVSYV